MSSYKFYIRQDGNVYGPYSIDEVRNLGLLDDTEVMESSVGEWYPANYYNFDELYMKEHGYYVGDDGHIHRGSAGSSNSRNTTGASTGYSDPHICPENAKGWSWGAFFFNWIWGICNNVYWPLVMIPIALILTVIAGQIGYIVSQISYLIIMFVLGANGREMAWKNGNWRTEDVERFNSKQGKWSSVAGWLFFIWLIFAIIGIISLANS